jgi:oxysterol-binding protein 1
MALRDRTGVCLCLCLCVCVCVCVCLCRFLPVCLSVYLSVSLSPFWSLSVCLSASVCVFVGAVRLVSLYACFRRARLCHKNDSMAPQVCHHPPISAQHTEAEKWELDQEFSMSSKFRGKYLQIVPTGLSVLRLKNTNDVYSWCKVTSTIHNIIVGQLWIDQHGSMVIHNHTTGDVCELNYAEYSYFSRDPPRRVTGVVKDASGTPRVSIEGFWDQSCSFTVLDDPFAEPKTVWTRTPLPENSAQMHGFTTFACILNQPLDYSVPRCDSRLRPDQRAMESGDFETANVLKQTIEERQRADRRAREANGEHWTPRWFNVMRNDSAKRDLWTYTGSYWSVREGNVDDARFPALY